MRASIKTSRLDRSHCELMKFQYCTTYRRILSQTLFLNVAAPTNSTVQTLQVLCLTNNPFFILHTYIQQTIGSVNKKAAQHTTQHCPFKLSDPHSQLRHLWIHTTGSKQVFFWGEEMESEIKPNNGGH